MLNKIKRAASIARTLIGRSSPDAKPILKNLAKNLRRESKRSLGILGCRSADVYPVHELYAVIDNLTNTEVAVRRASRSKEWLEFEAAIGLIDTEIGRAMNLVRSGFVSTSIDAGETVLRTSNLLFTAKQHLKEEFGVITDLDLAIPITEKDTNRHSLPEQSKQYDLPEASSQKMVLSSAMLFQIGQSLFPPERMLVGATRRIGQEISVEALFDVTGAANSCEVKADPDRLGRALIAMAESDTYFGLWVHSHPGSGSASTHPSGIDTKQHADWLRDYSPNLVSAIVVRDRYIRFWGTALETGIVEIEFDGGGVEVISPEERVYRLAC
jgi:hypothetical protein